MSRVCACVEVFVNVCTNTYSHVACISISPARISSKMYMWQVLLPESEGTKSMGHDMTSVMHSDSWAIV